MEKSADAFRTISEVADDLELPQHVLRFWETKFAQIRPLKRAGGRRYYRPADIAMLRAIRKLLYEDGYTIKGVQRLLKEQGRGVRQAPAMTDPEMTPGDAALGASVVALPIAAEDLDLERPGSSGSRTVPDPSDDTRSASSDAAPIPAAIDRALLREALDLVEECKAILAAALGPAG